MSTPTALPQQPALLRYPGAKWTLAPRIVAEFGPHAHYVEPYFGSGAVFFTKPPSLHEVLNDIDGEVVNFWRVLREHTEDLCWAIETTPWSRAEYEASTAPADDPIESARRFAVRTWQAHAAVRSKVTGWRNRGPAQARAGMSQRWRKVPEQLRAVADRLTDAEIESRDALEVIERFNGADVLLYVDPPYLRQTRTAKLYAHETDDAHHVELLELLRRHRGPAVVSGYASELYDDTLGDWERVVVRAPKVEKGAARDEVLWVKRG
ncbi:hypothetical protein ACT17_22670 [Mycolicibacterium conceptionense]|uniref:Uncharacterized protein n=1 Tax=Mycolicibacterium conceptionense TaxID=451644 RepID=A0A0J8U642_9MYCO|nr:DNA adenine methylase [Mycolicibacterium conceptionense]KMV15910.1 hypothetical protein ACT17_22670 [Mycolicibacterium conceptionense]